MVYIKKWPLFQAQCLELYKKSPDKTRYLIKATPSQTWLVLKVTDDTTCLKYKARSSIILNRFETFTKDMTASMAGLPLPSAARVASPSTKEIEMKTDAAKASASNTASAQSANKANNSSIPGGGGTSKKKKGKKGGKK